MTAAKQPTTCNNQQPTTTILISIRDLSTLNCRCRRRKNNQQRQRQQQPQHHDLHFPPPQLATTIGDIAATIDHRLGTIPTIYPINSPKRFIIAIAENKIQRWLMPLVQQRPLPPSFYWQHAQSLNHPSSPYNSNNIRRAYLLVLEFIAVGALSKIMIARTNEDINTMTHDTHHAQQWASVRKTQNHHLCSFLVDSSQHHYQNNNKITKYF